MNESLDQSIFDALNTTATTNTSIHHQFQTQSNSFRFSTSTTNYSNDDDESSPTKMQSDHQPEDIKRSTSETEEEYDATATIHDMHRKLLYLMSNPQCFHDAIEWMGKVENGQDPTASRQRDDGGLEYEKEDGSHSVKTSGTSSSSVGAASSSSTDKNTKYPAQDSLIPPLPLQIFTQDAEVVLPEAMTASQLFGIERVTGIELEAAAGVMGLSHLFLRWLALMPEGDHMNIIDPPGLTVMRIAGGRYRVTGSHRVVWRWMNKFSPASAFDVPQNSNEAASSSAINDKDDENNQDTDFDFGDLVSMTIIDVFETEETGKLLSYCPTFDNRAVHKTQEVVERVRKGASHLKERVDVVVKSPTGQKCLKAASHFSMRKYTQAINVGNIVKNRIEEELNKRQNAPSDTSLDAVAGTDVADDQHEQADDEVGEAEDKNTSSAAATPALETISSGAERVEISGAMLSSRSKNEYYFSDDSTAASSPQPK